jgi:hypothetical protein
MHPVTNFSTVIFQAYGMKGDNSGEFRVIANAELNYKGNFATHFKRSGNPLHVIQRVSHGVFGRNCCESRN